jgi:hypothetical protein
MSLAAAGPRGPCPRRPGSAGAPAPEPLALIGMTKFAEPARPAQDAATAAESGVGVSTASSPGGEAVSREGVAGRVPDFYVVGHQKCGTTALYLMLRRHPEIFMPAEKEPRYFAPDLYSRFAVQREPPPSLHTLEGYLALFADALPEQRVGEASPQYLRSSVAAARIAELQPQARIVAILREPASFLRSFHQQMVFSHVETEGDLRAAMALEDARRAGNKIPRGSHHPKSLLYSDHVRYVEQLQRFHAAFPREQVLVLFHDELLRDNEANLRKVFRFLAVDDDVSIDAVQTETLAAVRSHRLHHFAGAVRSAGRNPKTAGPLARAVNAITPKRLLGGPARTVWRRAIYGSPPKPDQELLLELRRRFKPEVVALSDYLGRDLVAQWGYDSLGD